MIHELPHVDTEIFNKPMMQLFEEYELDQEGSLTCIASLSPRDHEAWPAGDSLHTCLTTQLCGVIALWVN